MNAGTAIVLAILVLMIGLVIYKMIKDKKAGRSSCSCGGSCSGCGMAGSCHKTERAPGKNNGLGGVETATGYYSGESAEKDLIQIEDRNIIKKITIKIDGMMCGMCESHINDAIRSNLKVKKLKTSHITGLSEFQTNDVISDEKIKGIIEKTGYRVLDIEREYLDSNDVLV